MFFHALHGSSYPETEVNITAFPEPRIVLRSIMLDPSMQGKGYGIVFFNEAVKLLVGRARSVLLDCWAGNTKLRSFYERAGCCLVGIAPEDDYEIAVFGRHLKG